MHPVRLLAAASLSALALSACAPSLGPPPPPPSGYGPPAAAADAYRAEDFSWSAVPGKGQLIGHLGFKTDKARYSCAGSTVILTPETPWSKRRMTILYKSADRAALPADEVRARTPAAPAGDYSAFIKRATCNAADKFSYAGLAEGAWYAITIAKPVAPGTGPNMALMRRVVTHAGRITTVEM
jgi:hypothetical protein